MPAFLGAALPQLPQWPHLPAAVWRAGLAAQPEASCWAAVSQRGAPARSAQPASCKSTRTSASATSCSGSLGARPHRAASAVCRRAGSTLPWARRAASNWVSVAFKGPAGAPGADGAAGAEDRDIKAWVAILVV